MRILLAVLATALLIACGSSPAGGGAPSPATPAVLVWTTWTPDPKSMGGPEPGYRPALSGLTGHDVKSAAPMIDPTGTTWEILLVFTAHGSALLSMLTLQNVAACGGDPSVSADANCAQRHLAIWVNLSQSDIDSWDDPNYVNKVSEPYDAVCVGQPCPKFISDPITLQQITGGEVFIAGAFTQHSAAMLAAAIQAAR